ncbi:ABC transporter permease [Microbacterium sp. SLBN-146]|uniref:ABC transporter permease n=1 Tax=Microbacterium sp. SLBN-146 TaxID=2768457 RepID=UPI001150AFC8|nr:ABC transporter permease [Microbacterium sp. SLBN-146]TQJ31736.1 peptide/nickel transport system permease protein [Microbacterium sp. SLBN-146]
MLTFILRRLGATILVLLVASFIVYNLTAITADPLRELRASNSPNREEQIANRIELLNLDLPPIVRYFSWLGGAAKCVILQCDLGIAFSRSNQQVTDAVGNAAGSTIQLVTAATIIAIIFGLTIGILTALRQYSGFDYTVTFLTFVVYSLPIFWVAVLLKEFGAIRLNAFLSDPEVTVWAILLTGLISGIIFMSVLGGSWKRRLITFGGAFIAAGGLLWFLGITGWFARPQIGIAGIIITGIGAAIGITALSTGLANRRALYSSLIVVGIWGALWYPLQFLFLYVPTGWMLFFLGIAAIGLGILVGVVVGGDGKREAARTAAVVSFITFFVVVVDRVLLVYPDYVDRIPQSGVIATIGSSTPGLRGDMWFQILDGFAHLILPTIALAVVSIAAYTRYARSSLLEVMNQDYVRTARAKGLTERTVVVRHAMRNALIPIATIIAFDIGALIGGAVITETIFAWKGMGALFVDGLNAGDVNLVMGFFVVTGVLAVIFNLIADLLYSALDPRIRVS